MNNDLKKLTGKNPQDFEAVAFNLVNKPDTNLFSELVASEDFLFDFVKRNVADRLNKVCNKSNYLNLLHFLKFYSPSYEEFIVSNLVNFGGEELSEKLLNLLKNGTEEEKIYCAKYFEVAKNQKAVEFLKAYAFSENPCLSGNCASALFALGDVEVYNEALAKLISDDEFEKLDAVKFLVAYGNKNATDKIIAGMKTSSMADNIAGELLYLSDLFEIYNNNKENGLFVFNSIISGLGEILGLSQVFDFRLYDFISMLKQEKMTPSLSVVLLSAKDKFSTLTENDEYLFDETKDTKQEIYDIKKLLSTVDDAILYALADEELGEKSLFVFTALEFTENEFAVRELLKSSNPALVLKSLETLKMLEAMTAEDKATALNSVADINVRLVIQAL